MSPVPEPGGQTASPWRFLLVEDNVAIKDQVLEFLRTETFGGRSVDAVAVTDMTEALRTIQERKADLVILDVYKGEPSAGGSRDGIQVLDRIQETGFVPVVLYTALTEGIESRRTCFVRLVAKDTGGLPKLKEEITDLFALRIPQLHRAVSDHFDRSLCTYMWQFVQPRWTDFQHLVQKPEFVRLVVQRLAMEFSRRGVQQAISDVFGAPGSVPPDTDKLHPAEWYVKPPLTGDPMLGDVRVRTNGTAKEHLVVLWPSCDMVSTGGRSPKTELVICAKTDLLSATPEYQDWKANRSEKKKDAVQKILKNTRSVPGGSPDRYHYLPGVWDIPDLVVDFQGLECLPLATVKAIPCIATLDSPYAESLAARFGRYLGRVGTPDLDTDQVLTMIEGSFPPVA